MKSPEKYTPNYQDGLNISSNAYDAVNDNSNLTSTEWFDFTPAAIYDTKENKWIYLTPEEFQDSKILEQYSDNKRYAVALGKDINNIDGFMNINDYIVEKGINNNQSDIEDKVKDMEQKASELFEKATALLYKTTEKTDESTTEFPQALKQCQTGETISFDFKGQPVTGTKTANGNYVMYITTSYGDGLTSNSEHIYNKDGVLTEFILRSRGGMNEWDSHSYYNEDGLAIKVETTYL